jgi:hypothetical protein
MKLTAKDLRIGNIIHFDDIEEGQVETKITWDDLKWASVNEKTFNEFHKPIPLTEELLLRFGGKKVNNSDWFIKFGGIEFYCRHNKFWYSSIGSVYLSDRVQFVHQLQNLYYSICNQELQLNQTT